MKSFTMFGTLSVFPMSLLQELNILLMSPQVSQLLKNNDRIEPISKYLMELVNNHMGITPKKDHCDKTAELLLEHKQAIIEGCA